MTVIGNPALYAGLLDEGAPILFAAPVEEAALIGTGSAHHVAWRVSGDTEQQLWLERLEEVGLRPTPAQDQRYFQSAYFRMPDGLLNEIATDSPGLPRRRAARVARPERSRFPRGSSRSARRSSGSSRRSSDGRRLGLQCRRSRALVAELVDALG